MLCCLSGQVPIEPVVSLKSGHVFEKRLILKYLEQNQLRCPITGQELDREKDLLAIQPSTTSSSSSSSSAETSAVFAPEAASVPQLLSLFQSEWDAVMLETFTLKQHLEQTRQELSHALYQHDAACRVIARLNAENEALKEKAAQVASGEQEDVDMTNACATLSPEVLANVEAKQKELAKRRKDFKKKEGPQRAALLGGFEHWKVVSSHTLHDSDKPGVTCLAIDSKRPTIVATGGMDKHAKIFDTDKQQLVTTLAGHAKKLSHVEFHPIADIVLTGSHDKTLKLWTSQEEGYSLGYTLDGYDDAVTSASIHPTGGFVLSGSLDATWAIHDIRRGQLLSRYALNGRLTMPENPTAENPEKAANEVRCARFHPDGGIFGTAAKSKLVQMWALNSLSNVVTFEGHGAPVSALCFSENGYHLASGSDDGVVKLWDLRKATSFFELDLTKAQPKLKLGAILSISFDASGSHVAVASAQAIAVLKEVSKNHWDVVKTFSDHKAAVTGVQFAPDSSFLASTSMDRSLKLYRQAKEE
ncbi:hypothetical protein PsorP6_017312 [Peronosclerospora sorghi]|uniref:Uncharacterized protein n=1 Tax=Peronosclerospora sorghi TaxID=230839 RepID=A0ACC0WNV9_9STRA|nr:hypothetical protein PsorP6_017312 [Peronosclerospora sorghi]